MKAISAANSCWHTPSFRAPALRGITTALLLLLAACFDQDGGPANTAPVAAIQPVAAAERGATVLLDGTGSSDEDGDELGYAWTIVSKPAGSMAELLASDVVSPAFVADVVGSYQVSLVVDDGRLSSDPAQTSITVTVPDPQVTISSPDDETITTTTPVMISGTVADADAVTVNGVAATIDNVAGTYTASIPLAPGSNVVTAEATSAAGTGQAAITVILNTANVPFVKIIAPKFDELLARTYLDTDAPQPLLVEVRGTIQVFTTEAVNAPGLTVNGTAATVVPDTFDKCPTSAPPRCFRFSVGLPLSRGIHTLAAVATDVLNGVGTATGQVVYDYAFRPSTQQWNDENRTVNPVDWVSSLYLNVKSIRQPSSQLQNARSQEIDGCSAPTGEAHRNNPMNGATENRASTAFGEGTQPPGEYLVYGQRPDNPLPCNAHDVCYQTVGRSRAACDDAFYVALRAVCSTAYPPENAAYMLLHSKYKTEQTKCFSKASTYYNAVRAAGAARFNKRQEQHTYVP